MYRPPFTPPAMENGSDPDKVEVRGLVPTRTQVPAFVPVPALSVDEEGALLPNRAVELREGPWSLLLATALRGAGEGQAPLVEDALLRRSDAAMSRDEDTRLRPLADQVALLETEYLAASAKYSDAEDDGPQREDWHHPQHYLEAMKVHERRMDRLQRGMRDAHERYLGAMQQLERMRAGSGDGAGTGAGDVKALGVELTQDGPGTSRVRVGAK